jgi:hypothetical protein
MIESWKLRVYEIPSIKRQKNKILLVKDAVIDSHVLHLKQGLPAWFWLVKCNEQMLGSSCQESCC